MMILSLAWRNALRSKQRTLITAGMVLLGTALLVVALTWIDGLMGRMMEDTADQIGHVRVVNPEYAAREQLMPIYENLPDVAPLREAALAVPGVRGAWPVISLGVTVTAGEDIGDVFGLATGGDPEWMAEGLGLKGHLAAGGWFTGAPDEVLVGRVLANRTGVKVGDELRILGQTQDGSISPLLGRVVGIVNSGMQTLDQRVYLPLERMQWMADIPDGAVELLVYGDDFQRAGELAARVRAAPGMEEVHVDAWSEREPWAEMIGVVGAMRGFIISMVVLITALGVLNTMMMAVLERTNEIGVLRAMGMTRFGAVALIVIEGTAIAVLGGGLGVGLGAVGGWLLETYGITIGEDVAAQMEGMPMRSVLYGDLTGGTVARAFLLGLSMAFIGSLLPALRAASIEPVIAMRAKR